MKKNNNIKDLWKIIYRSYRIFKRENKKFCKYINSLPICKGRSLNKTGQLYGVKRKWWFLERDKKYRARILSTIRGSK